MGVYSRSIKKSYMDGEGAYGAMLGFGCRSVYIERGVYILLYIIYDGDESGGL